MNPELATLVLELNNRGVRSIDLTNFDESIRDFSRALHIVKQVLALQGEEEQDELDCEDFPPSAPQDADFYFACCQQHVAKAVSIGEPFIFRSPIIVPSNTAQPTCFNYYVKLSYVLLYNLALSHHLSALSDGSTKKLQKAISLYELAYTIMTTEDISLSVLQTMAIVNNLGMIHSTLGAQNKSQQCFQHLLSAIMIVNDSGERDPVNQMEGFIMNVMPLILGRSRVAPAA